MADYSYLLNQFQQNGLSYLPSEIHGVLCGALALTPAPSEADVLSRIAMHIGEDSCPAALVGEWRQLRNDILAAYQGGELTLELLLPEAPIKRVAALAAWCEGFIAGFGDASASRLRHQSARPVLPRAVNEALTDLMAIRQAEVPEQLSEDDARDLVQIEEHCRMVALTIFTEMALQSNTKR